MKGLGRIKSDGWEWSDFIRSFAPILRVSAFVTRRRLSSPPAKDWPRSSKLEVKIGARGQNLRYR